MTKKITMKKMTSILIDFELLEWVRKKGLCLSWLVNDCIAELRKNMEQTGAANLKEEELLKPVTALIAKKWEEKKQLMEKMEEDFNALRELWERAICNCDKNSPFPGALRDFSEKYGIELWKVLKAIEKNNIGSIRHALKRRLE